MMLLTPARTANPPATRGVPFARLRGTVYPFPPPPAARVEELTPVGSGDPLADHLVAALAARLRTPFLEADAVAPRVEAYVADAATLDRAADDATAFLDRVIDHYLSGTPDPALRGTRAAELRRGLSPLPRPRNVLSAEFLARPAAAVRQDLARGVAEAGGELVAAVVESLRTLTRLSVCGLIDRPAAGVCRFTFFDEVLTRRVTKAVTRKRKAGPPPSASSVGRTVIGTDTVTEVETTTTERRFTRHEHHLMDATEAAVGRTRWPLPTPVEALAAAAPDWVRPGLRVVEGTAVVERSVTWESRTTTARVTAERDVPVYAPDPALVLGDFVLAGWGEDEIRRASRRRTGETHPAGRCARAAWTVGAVAAALAACRLTALAVAESSVLMGVLAALAAACAACCGRTAGRPGPDSSPVPERSDP